MNLFEIMLLDCILIIFPVMLYLFYKVYSNTLNFKKNNLMLDCALFSSYYLLIKYGMLEYNNIPLLIFDISLLIAYYKNKRISMLMLSFVITIYYLTVFKIPIEICFIEYIIYFILYVHFKDNKLNFNIFKNFYSIIKIVMFTFYLKISPIYDLNQDNFLDFSILMIIFLMISNSILYLYKETDEVVSIYSELKNREKEKQIKKSLFKITHEIKNPIAVCKGYLDMFDVNNLEHSHKYIPIIKSEINRTLVLLGDFLSITKINIEKEEMDLNLLLEETIECLDPILKNKSIQFISDITEEEIYIQADYNRLKQTIVNIIKNSRESIPESGVIKLSTNKNKNNVKIYIEDNGIGMTKEELSKIKEAFFSTKQTGTGLGVYMANEIITAHQGTLEYFSKKNLGTRVVITLPIA